MAHEERTLEKTSSLTSGDPNLEDIDFDKFYDMELSEEDEARELAFLLAQIPPPRVAHTFSTHSKNSRFQTSPSSPTLAQQSPGLVPLSPTPARRRFQTPLSSPAPARHRFQTPLSSPTPAQSSSSLVTLSPIQARQLVPSTRSPVVKTLRSPVSPCSMLSDEAAFWVVMSGAYPGVYHGRTAATAAMGEHSPRRAVKVGSRSEAEHEFSTWYMEGEIVAVFIE